MALGVFPLNEMKILWLELGFETLTLCTTVHHLRNL